jgi:teichuronic acid biosynthesis glycosyltransferase TuaH
MQANLPLFSKDGVDIVCFSLSRWDAEISSPAVSLAREFSKNNRVFFIEHPYSLKDKLIGKRQTANGKVFDNVHIVKPSVTLPINFLPAGGIYHLFSSINNSIVLKALRKTIKENGISNYVFINFFDPYFLRSIPDDIKPVRYVYQCMDDMSQVAYTRRHGLRLENEVIKSADLVLCTSRELTRIKSSLSPNVRFHPNAADFDLFNTAATLRFNRPADMPAGDKKIIGFTGSIEYRTDFELLRKVAIAHADKILFLIGPVMGNEHIAARLDKLSNVIFAGAKNINELPPYLQYFDCCMIPYKKNQLTASIYPLKVNEYLAAGKPVVSTDFSEDVHSFADVAYVTSTHDEFVQAIDRAIKEDDANKRSQRMHTASANSWEKRVADFWKLVI